jgi:hypothetical protein
MKSTGPTRPRSSWSGTSCGVSAGRCSGPSRSGGRLRGWPRHLSPPNAAGSAPDSRSPLSADDAQALLDADLDRATRAMLYRESGGNPFYLEQLARAARPGDHPLDVDQEQPDMGWSPPAVVAAAIRDELLQVSTEARLALDAAAVAGESFEPELIAAIADRPSSLAWACSMSS